MRGKGVPSPWEDGVHNRLSAEKRRSTRRPYHMSATAGGETTSRTSIAAPKGQAGTSNPQYYEDHHDCSTEKQVKEEYVSSGEEEISGDVEEHMSSREGVTCSEVVGHMSSGEEDTSSWEVEGPMSSEEEVMCLGEVKGRVSSVEEDASSMKVEGQVSSRVSCSRRRDLRNIEVVEGSPASQQKRGRKVVKFNIGRSKEISEDLRKQVVEAHKNGKGYKRIAKDLDLHLSTVRKIVYKWKKFSTVATLPRSGRPPKISAKARRTILRHMTENNKVTAKDLKASLALDNINVHESTIRKTLNKWCSWDFTMEEPSTLQQE